MARSRRFLVICLVLALMLAVILSHLVAKCARQRVDDAHAHLSGFDWFCEEFRIEGEIREKVEALHRAHFPECEEHCVHYADSLETLGMVNEDPDMDGSPEHIAASQAHRELEGKSVEVFRKFIAEVAEVLPPEEADRYLERMGAWANPSKNSDGRR